VSEVKISTVVGKSASGKDIDENLVVSFDSSGEPPTVGALAQKLGIELTGPEGGVVVIVNGRVVAGQAQRDFRLSDSDKVVIHRMVAGG